MQPDITTTPTQASKDFPHAGGNTASIPFPIRALHRTDAGDESIALTGILGEDGGIPYYAADESPAGIAAIETPLTAAIFYASLGWAVFPLQSLDRKTGRCTCGKTDCTSPAKHPRTKNGLKDATTDPARILEWWRKWPDANIGIATGAASAIFALDVDAKSDGPATLGELDAKHGALPETAEQMTGGGGRHFLFAHVEGIRNSAGQLGRGLDVRGEGGYIVAAPSLHISGRQYAWADRDLIRTISPAPAWLLDLILKPKPAAKAAAKPAPIPAARPALNGSATPYGRAALESELAELRRASEGNRNHSVNRAAFALGSLIAGGELPESETIEAIAETARSLGLPDIEVRKTIESGIRAGKAEPRTAPKTERPKKAAKRPAPAAGSTDGASPALEWNVATWKGANLSEQGNAEDLIRKYGTNVRFIASNKDFAVWDGRRWTTHQGRALVCNMAVNIGKSFYAKASDEETNAFEAEFFAKHAKKSLSNASIKAVVSLCESFTEIHVEADEFDQAKHLMNVANGTIDLRNGGLLPHDRDDMIRSLIPIEYDPRATCPTWERTIAQIFDHQEDLIDYVQRYAGYTATGETTDQTFLILHGAGANGKSLLIGTLGSVLGEYYKPTRAETLMVKRPESIPNDLAELWGARMVSAIETEAGTRMAQSLIKSMTGRDKIKARYLFREWFDYEPDYKLWLAVNHLPSFDGTDEGMTRRIRLIPFNVKFERIEDNPETQFPRDDRLPEKLKAEYQGILRWIVEGAIKYYRDGLSAPAVVKAATKSYAADMDSLAGFVETECLQGGDYKVKIGEFNAAYKKYCEENNEPAIKGRTLKTRMERMGFTQERTMTARWWRGVGLMTPHEVENDYDK